MRPAQPITNADPRSAACSSRRSSRTTSCDYWARSSGTSLRPRMRKEDHSRVVVVWVMGGNFMGCDLGIGGGGVVSLGPAQCVRLLVVRPGIFIFFIFFSSLFLFSLAALVVIPIEEGCDLSLCGIFWGKQHFGFVFLFFFFSLLLSSSDWAGRLCVLSSSLSGRDSALFSVFFSAAGVSLGSWDEVHKKNEGLGSTRFGGD